MHTYCERACADCGDMDGCHIPGKVKRASPFREQTPPGLPVAKYGQPFPLVVTLIGSTRFPRAYEAAMRAETLEGNIVIGVGLFGHQEALDMGGPVKAMLDELHLRKIDMADVVFVLNPPVRRCPGCERVMLSLIREETCQCGADMSGVVAAPYVGESTRRELAYARAAGKKIRSLHPLED